MSAAINLGSTHKALSQFQQNFLDENLPEGLSAADFRRFDRGRYDARSLALGRGAWELRTLDEYRSQVGFSELLLELTELGFAFDILSTAVRVVRDEARHVELCRRMVGALGGSDVIPGTPAWVRSDKTLDLRARVLQTIVGSLCIGETLSVRFLAAVRDATDDPLTKKVMTSLCADESIHSRFGWSVLELLSPWLSPEERADVTGSLAPLFLSVEETLVPAVVMPEADEAAQIANPFGFLSTEARVRVFKDSMQRDVIARFQALGFGAQRAWAERQALALAA